MGSPTDRYTEYTVTEKINHPALKYDRDLFEFFYEILSDDSRSIETSFVMVGMAAAKIDGFVP